MRKILFSLLTLALTFTLVQSNVHAETLSANNDDEIVAFSYVILNQE